jgi:hypothetical protein
MQAGEVSEEKHMMVLPQTEQLQEPVQRAPAASKFKHCLFWTLICTLQADGQQEQGDEELHRHGLLQHPRAPR